MSINSVSRWAEPMMRYPTNLGTTACREFRRLAFSRRQALQSGALALAGLGLGGRAGNSNSNPPGPADQDYYRVVAQQTGTLDFQVYFKNF